LGITLYYSHSLHPQPSTIVIVAVGLFGVWCIHGISV
jgi:hypothetical protein